jgi:hypothetical protein
MELENDYEKGEDLENVELRENDYVVRDFTEGIEKLILRLEKDKENEGGWRERRLREAEIQFKQMKSDELCRLREEIKKIMKIRRKLSSKLDNLKVECEQVRVGMVQIEWRKYV